FPLVTLGIDRPPPFGGEIAGDDLPLGGLRAGLEDGTLDVLGQLLESVPGDVPGGAPLSGPRLLIELGAVVSPHRAPVGHVVRADAWRLCRHLGATRRHAAVARPVLGDDAVLADVDVPDREAGRRRGRALAPALRRGG